MQNWYDGGHRKEHGPKLSQKNEYKEIHEIAIQHQEDRINFLKPYINKNTKLLDVGCSTGSFIGSIKNYIKEAVGTDIDLGAAKFAHEITGCKTFGGKFLNLFSIKNILILLLLPTYWNIHLIHCHF